MKTVLMIAIVIISGSAGDILLSRGMKQVGAIETLQLRALFAIARRALTNPSVIFSIASMAVAFFSLLAVLSWAPVSLVSPATAFGYVLNTFGAKFYLKEEIDKERWIGTLLVCIGAAFLSI
jgi:uncharacterized membrane protein